MLVANALVQIHAEHVKTVNIANIVAKMVELVVFVNNLI
jgi:hypothetical protein